MSDHVHKSRKSRSQKFQRLLGSTFDPRSWAHMIKIANFYNYTHVQQKRQMTCGSGVNIGPTANFANAQNITLGDRVSVGANNCLWAGPGKGRIILGNDVLLAPNVMITAANYRFNDGSPVNDQAMDETDIIIGDDVWLGAGVVVLAGAEIGDGAIVAAGTIVRENVPPMAIVSGTGGNIVGKRMDRSAAAPFEISADAQADPAVLASLHAQIKGLDQARLTGPIDDSGVDSFDLISLRVALEAAHGVSIPDRDWAGIGSLEDIAKLPVFQTGGAAKAMPSAMSSASVTAAAPIAGSALALPPGQAQRPYQLNMPQMALSGLGEAWLFKELGDIHWGMITSFLETPSSAIADSEGDRLYATFTRIKLDVAPSLVGFKENDDFDIKSELERYGASFFFGQHKVGSDTATATATTMSTFAKYGERGNNTSLMKGTPELPNPEAVPSLAEFPAFGTEYRARRAEPREEVLFECEYEILPCHDINGVGLLYFAAYPTVFDLCIEQFEGKGFLIGHSTVSKDILYYANSEPTETLIFRLHERSEEAGKVTHHASLYRKTDNARMSEVISVKAKV